MLAILLLSSISRCASPALCPSDEELIAAVLSRGAAAATAAASEARARGEILLFHPRPIQKIKDVICGVGLPVDRPTVACKMTLCYRSAEVFHVAKLVRQDGTWQIVEAMAVARDRR